MGAKSTSDAEAKAAILFLYNTFRAQRGRYGNAFTYIPRELEKFRAYARNVDGAVAVASMMKTIQRNGGFAHVEGLLVSCCFQLSVFIFCRKSSPKM